MVKYIENRAKNVESIEEIACTGIQLSFTRAYLKLLERIMPDSEAAFFAKIEKNILWDFDFYAL